MRRYEKILLPFASIGISIVIGAIIIWICGYDPIKAYGAMLKGSFGSLNYALNTLEKCVPLILCGLGAAVAMKTGMFNIGAEGQLFVGALGFALGGIYFGFLAGPIQMFFCIILGILFGSVWAFLPAYLKIRFGANEVVTSIMFNYIAKLLNSYLVTGPLKAVGQVPQTELINGAVRIREIVNGGKLTWGFVIAISICVIIWVLFNRTTTGYSITAAGINPRAAEAGGIKPNTVRIGAMLLSGALAGLAGCLLVASVFGRLVEVVSNGYGFDGIAIAVLGQFSPIGVFLSSILFGTLHTGSLYMEMFVGIPSEIISVLQGVMILIIASPLIIKRWFRREGSL